MTFGLRTRQPQPDTPLDDDSPRVDSVDGLVDPAEEAELPWHSDPAVRALIEDRSKPLDMGWANTERPDAGFSPSGRPRLDAPLSIEELLASFQDLADVEELPAPPAAPSIASGPAERDPGPAEPDPEPARPESSSRPSTAIDVEDVSEAPLGPIGPAPTLIFAPTPTPTPALALTPTPNSAPAPPWAAPSVATPELIDPITPKPVLRVDDGPSVSSVRVGDRVIVLPISPKLARDAGFEVVDDTTRDSAEPDAAPQRVETDVPPTLSIAPPLAREDEPNREAAPAPAPESLRPSEWAGDSPIAMGEAVQENPSTLSGADAIWPVLTAPDAKRPTLPACPEHLEDTAAQLRAFVQPAETASAGAPVAQRLTPIDSMVTPVTLPTKRRDGRKSVFSRWRGGATSDVDEVDDGPNPGESRVPRWARVVEQVQEELEDPSDDESADAVLLPVVESEPTVEFVPAFEHAPTLDHDRFATIAHSAPLLPSSERVIPAPVAAKPNRAAAGPATVGETSPTILRAMSISKTYVTGDETVRALQSVTLEIRAGELVVVMGASGSGKTTLLNCLSGLDDVDEGEVWIGDRNIRGLSDAERSRHRAAVMGFVFQNYNLLPVFSAVENVEMPLLLNGWSRKDARQQATSALERVGLGHRTRFSPNALSGGEQQRVAIARALVGDPQVVWADEPTGNLDSETAAQVLDLLDELNEGGLTVVLVTHDQNIGAVAPRQIVMRDGHIVADRSIETFN